MILFVAVFIISLFLPLLEQVDKLLLLALIEKFYVTGGFLLGLSLDLSLNLNFRSFIEINKR